MTMKLTSTFTLPTVGLLIILLCSVVRSAPNELQDTDVDPDKELAKNAPGDILSEDQSNETPDVNIDQLQEFPPATSGEIDSEEDSDEDEDNEDSYSVVDPNNLDHNLVDNFSDGDETDNYPQESSFFKSSDNDLDFMANYDDDKDNSKLEELLCTVLDMCDLKASVGAPAYRWEGSDYSDTSSDNEIKVNAEPMPNFQTIDADENTVFNDNGQIRYRMKRSAEEESKHGHRSKRDLSVYDVEDDDIVPLDILAEVLANENQPMERPQNNLVDVLGYIEGIRRDRMTAGDILDEFEEGEAMGGVPFEVDDSDTEPVFRKRGSTARDIKHFVQTLPTLEGMKKRSDRRLNYDDLNDIDIVAAENELAAEELQEIETKAQVAAAMLENAAMLISVIENMAVELVGEYLGLEDEDELDDNTVEFDELTQYMPPVPPVSVEKRIGRDRGYRYPASYDVPFAPEDAERPFKGAYETASKPRVWNPPSGYSRSNSYRRPSNANKYRSLGRQPVSPPFLGSHIGIFPNNQYLSQRYRRIQPFQKNDIDSFPSQSNRLTPQELNILDLIGRKEKPRLFPVNDNAMGRYSNDGNPYLDGFFNENKFGRDRSLEDGLQQAFDAASLMQDRIDRENELLAEQEEDDVETAVEDAYIEDFLSSLFRNRIRK